MSLIRSVRHVQFACQNLHSAYRVFVNGFGFKLHSFKNHDDGCTMALENGECRFLISQTVDPSVQCGERTSELMHQIIARYKHRQSPVNVALEVHSVQDVCDRISRLCGSEGILIDPVAHTDQHGEVTMAVVKSCIGNLLHTVLDTSKYHGMVLPGFSVPGSDAIVMENSNQSDVHTEVEPPVLKHLDHIALVCNTGESDRSIRWYENVFGMRRVAANTCSNFSLDDPDEGFFVQYGLTGMRLKAASYADPYSNSCTFVFVEPTENSAPNQVTRFLDANGGPGLQHVGFAVDDIFKAVECCKARGTRFIQPPESYYTGISSSPSFTRWPVSLEKLTNSGVLLDPDISSGRQGNENHGVLLQIFTEPLFEPDNFFVELIQRYNAASGFGAGNIVALWKAVEDSIASGDRQTQRGSQ